MRRLLLIGIGAGDPEQVTLEAVRALNEVDVFLVLGKGERARDLMEMRTALLDRFVEEPTHRTVVADDPVRSPLGGSYEGDVRAWHEARTDLYERLLLDELDDDEVGGVLVWGDPSLYDSTIRVVDEVVARGRVALAVEVIPGISSVQALAARHRIALHAVGRPVLITTGRRLADGWPEGVDDVVVMLDAHCTFTTVDPEGVDIYWGAYLGTSDEILVAGPLGEKGDEIRATRDTARDRKGWIFDIYLLRRRPPA